jgi:hypothetical protein
VHHPWSLFRSPVLASRLPFSPSYASFFPRRYSQHKRLWPLKCVNCNLGASHQKFARSDRSERLEGAGRGHTQLPGSSHSFIRWSAFGPNTIEGTILLVCNFLSPSCYSMHCRVTYVLLNRQIHTTIGTTMLFQYTIIFIFNVLHVSSSFNSSSGTVYELSLKLHMASQYTLKIKCCTQL